MGGNAIKTVVTRRYSKDEYFAIIPTILEKVKTKFTDAVATTAYSEKESFGDADILVLVDKPITFNISDWIYQEFNSKEVVNNSSVYSFEYNELQVDLILTKKSNWETAQTYFSYNDIHNLIGKVAKRFGLKWGFDGLQYVYRLKDKKLGTICITKNRDIALDFLGFDVQKYNNGFKNLNEIFDYITTSKYFNPCMFDLAELNRINRERDLKRTTYAQFLKHIEPLKENNNNYQFFKNKKYYIGLINHYFPHFLEEYNKLSEIETNRKLLTKYYNGKIIMSYFPTLKGKELGDAMFKFKAQFIDSNEFNEYIFNSCSTIKIMNDFSKIL